MRLISLHPFWRRGVNYFFFRQLYSSVHGYVDKKYNISLHMVLPSSYLSDNIPARKLAYTEPSTLVAQVTFISRGKKSWENIGTHDNHLISIFIVASYLAHSAPAAKDATQETNECFL